MRQSARAILFRLAESLAEWITYKQLVDHGVIKAAPQTIKVVQEMLGLKETRGGAA